MKFGRNIQWVEIFWNVEKLLMMSSLIRKYDIIIVIVFIVPLFLDGLS